MNPNNSAWSFCFNEVELFFNISCPHHQIFKNRNLGDFITFIVNPRENFDYAANGNKKQGVNVREIIRNRVKQYNNDYLLQSLGFFGSKDNFEWKQYTLDELSIYQTRNIFTMPFNNL